MEYPNGSAPGTRTGWEAAVSRIVMAAILMEAVTGLVISFGPFHPAVAWTLLVHTALGVVTLVPVSWYLAAHWADYRSQAMSDVVLLGYIAAAALALCVLSGLAVTWQALFGIRTSAVLRQLHFVTTLLLLGCTVPHAMLSYGRRRAAGNAKAAQGALRRAVVWGLVPLGVIPLLTAAYSGTRYVNQFPKGYNFVFGKNRPFAPSLARTSTGGAFDARSLAGSENCGSAGCHSQILAEWKPSAHRYAAMDTVFQTIQGVMAKQNGPESTRYCGGCHDPISLFSGTKNILVKDLTSLAGYAEGVSCVACHSIQKTDIRGNANYTLHQPREYLWQWSRTGTAGAAARNFLIRSWPAEHNRLSKRMFKKPEYCAACHKQFIDQEVNRVGWVQLQNQYDNWAASHWNHKGDARKTLECRECHMPLVDSTDPAAGDASDYNRSPDDGKHRSHRFLASNNFMPQLLHLEGADRQVELTRKWLEGTFDVPEIKEKWATGPVVKLRIEAPPAVKPGQKFAVRIVLTSNKVGHDYPTGPLDLIQSWVELKVADDRGRVVFASGRRDARNFIEPGSFLFKAEPVDQYGNLIDRHNLWEMVGVRYRRSMFPGYSDTVEYRADCPKDASGLEVSAVLHYRKLDQYLINYVMGPNSGVTSPVVDITSAAAKIPVLAR